jgi:hypothetical protein
MQEVFEREREEERGRGREGDKAKGIRRGRWREIERERERPEAIGKKPTGMSLWRKRKNESNYNWQKRSQNSWFYGLRINKDYEVIAGERIAQQEESWKQKHGEQ